MASASRAGTEPPVEPMAATGSQGAPSALGIVGLLVAVEFVSGLVQGMIPTLTPSLGTALGVSIADLGWISTAFLLSSALWVPVFSKLGDIHGHRKILRLSVVLLAVGSVLVAVAPTYLVLLAGRVLQGALLCFLPLEMALVRDRLAPEQARAGIAMLIGALTVGASLGPVVAGQMTRWFHSAQGVLWIPAVAAIACISVPFLFVPESRTRARVRIDWAGASLLAIGLAMVMLGIAFGPTHGWSDGGVLGLLAGGAAVLVVWSVLELWVSQPLVDIRHFSRPRVLVLYTATILVGAASFGPQTAMVTFAATPEAVAGYGLGLTGPGIGWFLLPLGVAAFTASAFAARLAQWAGQRTLLVTGFTTIAVGFAFTGSLSVSAVRMDGALILVGFGTGAVMSTLPAMILERLPEQEAGISAGVYNMLRTLGGSVASAAVSAVLAGASSGGAHLVAASGYRTVWIACAVLAAAAAALVLTAVRTAVPSSGSV